MSIENILTEVDIVNSKKDLNSRHLGNNVRILLIRHAESEMNTCPDIICGRSVQTNLTNRGFEQAKTCGQNLNSEFPEGFTSIYSSPTVRTKATAEAILSSMVSCNQPIIQFDDRLLELCMGSWTGKNRNEVYSKDVVDKLDIFHRPPGVDENGDSGESQMDVEERMVKFMNDVVRSHPNGSVVAVVSHGIAIKCFLRYMLQMGPIANLHINLKNTSVTDILYKSVSGDKGGWHLNRLGV